MRQEIGAMKTCFFFPSRIIALALLFFIRADKSYYIEIDVDLHQLKRLFLRGF
jgi:hypothetical protein